METLLLVLDLIGTFVFAPKPSSSALALSFSSIVHAWRGDDAIAVEQANRALRLRPFDPWIYMPKPAKSAAAGGFAAASISIG